MKEKVFLIFAAILFFSCKENTVAAENKEPQIKTAAESSEPLSFSAEDWKKSDIYVRGSFINEIKSKKVLSGLSRTEVITLLGEPDKKNDKSITYTVNIGAKLKNGTPINHFFYIYFDENDIFKYSRMFD